jgi:hypothetical protein
MDRLIWKDMYIVWDKMKDETDELRESLKRFCKLSLSVHRGKLIKRYRLDTILRTRIAKSPKLRNLTNPKGEPRM